MLKTLMREVHISDPGTGNMVIRNRREQLQGARLPGCIHRVARAYASDPTSCDQAWAAPERRFSPAWIGAGWTERW